MDGIYSDGASELLSFERRDALVPCDAALDELLFVQTKQRVLDKLA